jgi:hypothetical protein
LGPLLRGNEEIMKKNSMKKYTMIAFSALLLTCSFVSVAFADSPKDGGSWKWGSYGDTPAHTLNVIRNTTTRWTGGARNTLSAAVNRWAGSGTKKAAKKPPPKDSGKKPPKGGGYTPPKTSTGGGTYSKKKTSTKSKSAAKKTIIPAVVLKKTLEGQTHPLYY